MAVSNCCSCDLCVALGFHVPKRLVVTSTHSWLTLTQAFGFRAMNGIAFPVKRAFITIMRHGRTMHLGHLINVCPHNDDGPFILDKH